MEEYTTATANEIMGLLWAYNVGYLDDKELCEELQSLMNYNSFCIEQQKRVDSGLPPTVVTQQLIQAMRDFLKEDYTRFSGMDLEKGLVNELDRLHMSIESWVNSFEDYYKSPIEIIFEPQQEETEERHTEPIPQQRKKGKPIKSFNDCFICETEEKENLLKRLHSILKGEKGKNVALAILICVENGKMKKPTFKAINNEFGDIGNESGFNKYYSGKAFTDEEKTGMMKALFTK